MKKALIKTTHKSKIGYSGTKFIVENNSQDNVLGPGTTGIISYVRGVDVDYENVVFLTTVINRRGKNGMERIELKVISTPVYDFKGTHVDKYLPDKKRQQYVYIDKIPEITSNVMKMTDIDYLSWAYAKCLFMYELYKTDNKVYHWPADMLFNRIKEIPEYYDQNINIAKTDLCTIDSKLHFLKELRLLEAFLTKGILLYLIKIKDIEIQAITSLISKWESKKFPYTRKSLTTTFNNLNSYKEKLTYAFHNREQHFN